jgi:inhibitor of KinA sporulation pathway (predicted exonuclease)
MLIATILDMEYTTWEGARERLWSGIGEHREIVQIGAKKIEISSTGVGRIIDTLNIYVKPQINTKLSELFISLTAISQEKIDKDGLIFDKVIEPLSEFIGNNKVFSWTNNDFSVICENVELFNIPNNPISPFFNLQEVFEKNKLPTKLNSGHLAQSYNLPAVNQEHNALDDVSSMVSTIDYLLSSKIIKISDFDDLTPQWKSKL